MRNDTKHSSIRIVESHFVAASVKFDSATVTQDIFKIQSKFIESKQASLHFNQQNNFFFAK